MKNEGQIFPRWSNTLAWGSIAGLLLMGGAMICVFAVVSRSPYLTRVDIPLDQPVPFSHEHHVGGMGIDCRYCHTTSEISPFAGVPSTETCMTCHSQIWKDAPILQPIRDSFLSGKPVAWNRVHDLPDFVYFDHSAHVNKGVACRECHGQVDQMPLISRRETLFMGWCLSCHRHPEEAMGPREAVFAPRRPDQHEIDSWLKTRSGQPPSRKMERLASVATQRLTDCSACHR
jgi:hypothetical protein